jgi:hypothetical protein
MAAVGLELNLIDTSMESAIIMLAIITSIGCPTLFRRMHKVKDITKTEKG